MTDFEGHLKLGITAAIIAAVVGFLLLRDAGLPIILSTKLGVVLFVIVVIGALIPDVDHHASKPRQYLGLLLIGSGVGGAIYIHQQFAAIVAGLQNALLSILSIPANLVASLGLLTLLLVGVFLALLAGAAIDALLTHRGFTHSKGFALFFGLVSAGIVFQMMEIPPIAVGLVAAAGVFGVFVHFGIGDR